MQLLLLFPQLLIHNIHQCTNDLEKAIIFYDGVLKELNLKRVETDPEYAAYAPMDKPTEIEMITIKMT